MSLSAAARDRVRSKARGARRRALVGVLSLPPVRRRLHRRASLAWHTSDGVAFVCLGNICRSPFAEGVAKRERPRARITSAGTFPKAGRRSPETAVAVARDWAVDLGGHRSRVFDQEPMPVNAAVFVFDADNLVRMWRDHPTIRGRLHLLGALSMSGPLMVGDPYGGTAQRFRETYETIARLIRGAEQVVDESARPGLVRPAERSAPDRR